MSRKSVENDFISCLCCSVKDMKDKIKYNGLYHGIGIGLCLGIVISIVIVMIVY